MECWVNEEGLCLIDIQVVIGLFISVVSYIVDDCVINEVWVLFFLVEFVICEMEKGQYQFDLKEVNCFFLIYCGILEENILVSGLCIE